MVEVVGEVEGHLNTNGYAPARLSRGSVPQHKHATAAPASHTDFETRNLSESKLSQSLSGNSEKLGMEDRTHLHQVSPTRGWPAGRGAPGARTSDMGSPPAMAFDAPSALSICRGHAGTRDYRPSQTLGTPHICTAAHEASSCPGQRWALRGRRVCLGSRTAEVAKYALESGRF
jgi:hypothetical protein